MTKKANTKVEEKVNEVIDTVVDKTIKETKTEKTDSEENVIESNNVENTDGIEEKTDSGVDNGEKSKDDEKVEVKTSTESESGQNKEEKIDLEKPEKVNTNVSTDVSGELKRLLKIVDYYSHLNIGKHLRDKENVDDKSLKAFYDEFKSGNYCSTSEDFKILYLLGEMFK